MFTVVRSLRCFLALVLLGLSIGRVTAADAEPRVDFARDIRPILSDTCFACHGPDSAKRESELRLDQQQSVLADLGGHFAVIPGKPDESELVRRIQSSDPDTKMPPASHAKQLSVEQRNLLIAWIRQGAPWQEHWAFAPLQALARPESNTGGAAENIIDAYIDAKLNAKGWSFSDEADRRTLLRRLSFDLNGLPPNIETLQAFEQDMSAQAYETVVDGLLASPHYGERMAVYWLDLVRYADSVGYHGDQPVSVSPYRDYVIDAFNRNMPFDQFTREQLAGDLLENRTEQQWIASGYNRLGMMSAEGGAQPKEYLAKYAADRVRTTASVWMGVTMGCAECHNHKYDPFSTHDFYRFAAFFADIEEQGVYSGSESSSKWGSTIDVADPQLPELLQPIDDQLAKLRTELAQHAESDPAGVPLRQQLAELEKSRSALVQQHSRSTLVTVSITPRTTRVLPRGNWMDESGEEVLPGIPTYFGQLEQPNRATRLDLANWLVANDNALTSRVLVNRLWKLLFGVGLSRVLDDLGAQGEPPVHPELLDALARELVQSGWDVKRLMKLMVMSRAYRQASIPTDELRQADPYNRYLARQSRFRLDAEFIRDNALSVSGLLVRRVGGVSAKPYQPAGLYRHLNFPPREYVADQDDNQYRRGVYTHWQRQFVHPAMKTFDAPSREECTAERGRSNTPLGALVLLNDPSYVEAARVLAMRVLAEQTEHDRRIDALFLHSLQRLPTPPEREILEQLIDQQQRYFGENRAEADKLLAVGLTPADSPVQQGDKLDRLDAVELAAWTTATRAVFNMYEFVARY